MGWRERADALRGIRAILDRLDDADQRAVERELFLTWRFFGSMRAVMRKLKRDRLQDEPSSEPEGVEGHEERMRIDRAVHGLSWRVLAERYGMTVSGARNAVRRAERRLGRK
jgi:hypothetical protein